MDLNRKILSDIVVYSKYARFLPEKNRRETWDELVTRNKEMHIKKFPHMESEIEEAYKYVYRRDVLPSMRSLQFGGRPIEANPARIYNCSFLHVDDYRAFSETMFLLLCGTGVGYSVQNQHIEKLPPIRRPLKKRRFLVGDSIEGWADAIKALMKAYMLGSSLPVFDFSDIRPKGALLITSGGKAPGPEPLKECLFHIQKILDRKADGEQLSSIECHDIMCYIADAVLAGGIRRSAMIALFDMDDQDMLTCKFGDWYVENPQRGRANNSVVLVRHKMKDRVDFDKILKAVEESRAGEPGVFWTNDANLGTNPSLRAGTKVITSRGIFPIEELEGKDILVKNLNGEWSPATCFLSGKGKTLYKITLAGGHEYYCTAEHKWPVLRDGKYTKTLTTELVSGDLLPVNKSETLFDGDLGTYEDGFYIGWQYGDGWITERNDCGSIQHGMVVSEKDCESGIHIVLENYLSNIGSEAKFNKRNNGTREFNTINCRLTENLNKFGAWKKEFGLPRKIWQASEEFRKGFVDGIFSSDGNVEVGANRIRLTSKHKNLLKEVSELLGFYGIRSSISKPKITKLKGYNKEHVAYILSISDGASIAHFRDTFKLSLNYKQKTLDSYIISDRSNISSVKIVSVEKTEIKEDVWDITVNDNTHCFQIAHAVTGNCGEISLHTNQFCNLCEINASDIVDQQDYENRVRAAALIGTLQASYTDFHYLRDVWKKTTEKEALLGIGMTGIASGAVLSLDMTAAAKVAVTENQRVAKLIGVNPAARVTTVKPSGTTALVVGSSSGVHAWHNDYYIRRMRIGKNEPIYNYLSQNHPELVEDEYFKPHLQAVVSIPIKAPDGAILRTESALETLERVKNIHRNWIVPGHRKGQNTHNVSCTISIKDNEWQEVCDWMWENREFYSGISVLPYDGGTYIQAPHEDCSPEKYDELTSKLKDVDLSMIVELHDDTDLAAELACAGGACSIEDLMKQS